MKILKTHQSQKVNISCYYFALLNVAYQPNQLATDNLYAYDSFSFERATNQFV